MHWIEKPRHESSPPRTAMAMSLKKTCLHRQTGDSTPGPRSFVRISPSSIPGGSATASQSLNNYTPTRSRSRPRPSRGSEASKSPSFSSWVPLSAARRTRATSVLYTRSGCFCSWWASSCFLCARHTGRFFLLRLSVWDWGMASLSVRGSRSCLRIS